MTHRIPRPCALAALAAALASCASRPSIPPQVFDLYDAARPDGLIELEIDRDGTLREAEAEIAVDDVPPELVEAALRHVPGARVVGAEREHTSVGFGYELQLDLDGAAIEIVLDARGHVIETERALDRSEAPLEVLRAADEALPGATFRSVEVVSRGGALEYHVKKVRHNGVYKAVITPDGALTRLVREARAEIEIPVAAGELRDGHL